ncbi:MAG: hypothetical protein Q7R70_02975 [Candidatus Diapherotrites archaeon]|nr:hypothetical protein [Candidatus Diapherotrites archaeon]
MHFRTLFWAFALALLLQNAVALSSNIDINIAQTDYYIKDPQNITLKFGFSNLRDDDLIIDRVDFYILDLKSNNVDFVAFSGSDWQHEYLAKFDDDHFWITNASGQTLNVTVKPNFTTEGSYDLQAYYQFFDQTGSMVGLGDNRPVKPLNDVVDHVFARIIVDKTPPLVSFTKQPSWVAAGLSIEASVSDANPLVYVRLAYNSSSGQKTISMKYNSKTKLGIATIPLADIKEGTLVNYTVTAGDRAGNIGTASESFMASDLPQISGHPDTLLPQVPITLIAKIIDSSGVNDASITFTVDGKNEQTLPMAKGSSSSWSAVLGSFPKGAKIDYAITAHDSFSNVGNYAGTFSILDEYAVKFNVKDAVLKTPVKNVNLTVSSRVVDNNGANFTIPEKTFVFDDSKTFTQLEGSYYFIFDTTEYPQHRFLFNIQSDMEKDILLGAGVQSSIKSADIKPKIADDNESFYLEIKAVIQEAYPVKTIKLIYSINTDSFSEFLDLSKNSNGEYVGTLGPFTDQIVLYSKIELVDASEQAIIYDLGIRWYNLLSTLNGLNIGVELCGNGKDDNNNGLIDEGCPCKEADTQTCSNNRGVCKVGTQKCLNGAWNSVCEGGVTPSAEICGNSLDDDCDGAVDNGCFIDTDGDGLSDEREIKLKTDPRNPDTDGDNVSDGQEVLYDSTDPLDAKSNLLYTDLRSNISLGETQEIKLFHPKLGQITAIEALIISPSGKEDAYSPDAEGTVSFKPTEAGTYSAKIAKKNFEVVKSFAVSSGLFSIFNSAGVSNSVSYVFGESAAKAPLDIILVIILCILVGFVANSQYNSVMRPKRILSSSQERKELIKRTALVIFSAALPLIAFRIFGILGALVIAVLAVIAYFFSGFAAAKFSGKKAIRVESEESEGEKKSLGKLAAGFKGLFVSEKKQAEIKQTKEWKKLEWTLDNRQQKAEGQTEDKQGKPLDSGNYAQSKTQEKGIEYITPETASKFDEAFSEKEQAVDTSKYADSSTAGSTKSIEVWKRFEPVEFEERMTEIGKEVEKSLEKKLLEVGEEIEGRVGKKLAEVEEEVDKRVSRRLMETEETIERRMSRKLSEVEDDVDRKLKRRMDDLEDEIGREVEKKISKASSKTKQKTLQVKKIKRQALLRKIAEEELKKTEVLKAKLAAAQLQQARAQVQEKPAAVPTPVIKEKPAKIEETGFVLKETKQPTALALVSKTEELQVVSKNSEQKMQDLTKQLAMLNESFSKGLVKNEEFQARAKKLREELQKI